MAVHATGCPARRPPDARNIIHRVDKKTDFKLPGTVAIIP
jgi:hypothetical protein